MTADTTALVDGNVYRALNAKDARVDGRFFSGVTSSGIDCRPELAPHSVRWSIQDAACWV
jgi:AraC family transcriptional regulator of adaptative response / DNA-3-methyladenine glycosylase II